MSERTMGECKDHVEKIDYDPNLERNSKKVSLVFILSFLTMWVEIYYGKISGSLSLLADGWHMASHVAALGVSILAYYLVRSEKLRQRLSFGTGKIVALGGYTSSIVLLFVGLSMGYESVHRFLNPTIIETTEALWVAAIGLLINVVSVMILHSGDSDHDHSDLNLKSAYLHVVSDLLTSVLAIAALLLARFKSFTSLDTAAGFLGGILILKWALGLIKKTGGELLDEHHELSDTKELTSVVEETGAKVVDLHVWKLGPNSVACELVVQSQKAQGADFYRSLLSERFGIHHMVVEERISG